MWEQYIGGKSMDIRFEKKEQRKEKPDQKNLGFGDRKSTRLNSSHIH